MVLNVDLDRQLRICSSGSSGTHGCDPKKQACGVKAR